MTMEEKTPVRLNELPTVTGSRLPAAPGDTTLRLLSSRILVKPDKPLEQIGSIIIPHSARKPTDTGRVVAMGPGMLMATGERWKMPDIKPGDHVIYDARNPFVKVKINGQELIQLRDDDLYAVLED